MPKAQERLSEIDHQLVSEKGESLRGCGLS
jgi:hypothetical protein